MLRRAVPIRGLTALAVALTVGTGCQHFHRKPTDPGGPVEVVDPSRLPKELNKVSLPPYTVEPPDVLLINAQRLIPLPPYKINPLDVLYVSAAGAPEREPINGLYPVDAEGAISLGASYGGMVKVADLSTVDAEAALNEHLKRYLKDPAVSITLAQSKGVQAVRGEHLVRPDGTVGLGTYGSVHVAGQTLPQARATIETHLAKYLLKPEISVDVAAFNSKYYFVITDFAGSGEQVARLPCTGNETVLDAISMIGGLSAVSSKQLWVARPAPDGVGDQVLPVDWQAVTRRGQTKTNYQLLPGDRVYVMSQPLSVMNTYIARAFAPIERIFGLTLLGTTTVQQIVNGGQGGIGGF